METSKYDTIEESARKIAKLLGTIDHTLNHIDYSLDRIANLIESR